MAFSTEQLWCHPWWGAGFVVAFSVGVGYSPGKPKVNKNQLACCGDHNVFWFEIIVDNMQTVDVVHNRVELLQHLESLVK